MANITKNWTVVASRQVTVSPFAVTFYIEARYTSQTSVTTREVRLRSKVDNGSGSGSDYSFACTGCPTISGSAVWYFKDEVITSGSGTVSTTSETLSATVDCGIFSSAVTFSGTATYPAIANPTLVVNPSTLTIGSTETTVSVADGVQGRTYVADVVVGNSVVETINMGTWTPSAATYNALFPTSVSGTATLRLKESGSSTVISTKNITLNIDTRAYAPVFDVTDDAPSPVFLNASDITFTLTASLKPNSGASGIAGAWIELNGKKYAMTLNNGVYTYTVNDINTPTVRFIVTDSRGVSSSVSTSWDAIPYIPLTLNCSIKRQSAVSDTVTLTYRGNYLSAYDPALWTNRLTVTMSYRNSSGTTTGVTLTPTINAAKKTFSGTRTLTGFTYNTSGYTITVTATDKLKNVTVTTEVPISAPVWSVGRVGNVNHFDVHGMLRVVAQADPDKAIPVYHNGTNAWIGAKQKADTHFSGGLYLSTGYDESNLKGNETYYVAVPNDTNTNSTLYQAWHEGNAPINAYLLEIDWSTGSHSADDAPVGAVWCRAQNVTNLPVSTGFGWLITIGKTMQLFALHSTTGITAIYYRGYHSSVWDAWNLLSSMDVEAVDYNALSNKPKINSVTLTGNQTSADLNLQDPISDLTDAEIDNIVFGS